MLVKNRINTCINPKNLNNHILKNESLAKLALSLDGERLQVEEIHACNKDIAQIDVTH